MDTFLFTCEHGGNRIPAVYRALFRGQRTILDSHRGFDAGASVLAGALARAFAAPLVAAKVSRLLVDLNRSTHHRQVFSAVTRALPPEVRRQIVEAFYVPHRARIDALVADAVARGQRVIHVGVHSFTPVLDGGTRNADVGLLYDPRRHGEVVLSKRWQAELGRRVPGLRVRRNYPYAGKNDGLTSALRAQFAAAQYVGIELEVNQAIVFAGGTAWRTLQRVLVESLRTVTTPFGE